VVICVKQKAERRRLLMAKFKPYRIDQRMLLPPSLHDFIPANHLARLVDRVVEKLNTGAIEDTYSELGQNTYHPKILIKLLFYGYAVGERSGRVIGRRCETDTAYMFLAQMYRPDFRTINDFRKNNTEGLSQYFVDIVRMCKELGLVRIGQISIDSTKIKANAANRRTKTRDEYREWLRRVNKKIEEILEEADRVDAQEDEIYGDKRGDELPEDIDTEEKLKQKLQEVTKQFKTDREKINLTDSEARFMKGGDGRIDIGYNCQAAVTDDQLIVSSEVLTDPNDRYALERMVETTEENTGEEVKEVGADGGYSGYENYEYLSNRGKVGYIPDPNINRVSGQKLNKYHQDHFTYDKERDEYRCPEGFRLRAYKVRRQDAGYRRWRQVIYKGLSCPSCGKRDHCTTQRYRTIARDDRKELVEEMRKRLETPEGQKKYIKRLYTVEPIFGHLKHNLGYRHFLIRGLEKVRTEFKLMCIGYNLKKMNQLLAATP
jgi:transposase